jgi:hypothetical protein
LIPRARSPVRLTGGPPAAEIRFAARFLVALPARIIALVPCFINTVTYF